MGCFGADGVEAQPRGEVTKHVEHVGTWGEDGGRERGDMRIWEKMGKDGGRDGGREEYRGVNEGRNGRKYRFTKRGGNTRVSV